jgi:hypothetical protein
MIFLLLFFLTTLQRDQLLFIYWISGGPKTCFRSMPPSVSKVGPASGLGGDHPGRHPRIHSCAIDAASQPKSHELFR